MRRRRRSRWKAWIPRRARWLRRKPTRKANNIGTCHFRQADVFEFLSGIERRYSMVVLDPPAFAKSRKAVDDAARGYKEINLRALRLLDPGGILVTCSCSHHMSEAMFYRNCGAGGAGCGQDAAGAGAADAGGGPSDSADGTGNPVPEMPGTGSSVGSVVLVSQSIANRCGMCVSLHK